MKLKIDLKESSTPLEFNDVKNSYTKGPLFCIYTNASVTKIPIQNIWRIVEDYVSANAAEVKPAWEKLVIEAWDKGKNKPTLMKRFGSGSDRAWDDTTKETQSEDKLNSLIDIVDWVEISDRRLEEDFIRDFQDCVVWEAVSGGSVLSEDFIREFKDKVDWDNISSEQALSEDFIREFQDWVNWDYIFFYQGISEEFEEEFKHKQ
jgi:hypothetical protein